MNSRAVWWKRAGCGALVVALFTLPAHADETKPGATIIGPKDGDKVSTVALVQGRVHLKGWPICLVAAENSVEGWWVQAPASPSQPGHFQVSARIGNLETKPGTAFKLMVVMARTPEEYSQFKPGEVVVELPEDLPRSESIRVTLKEDNAPRVADVVASPRPMSSAGRSEMVRGKVARGKVPVLLVRPADPRGEWWVQKAPTVAEDGRFEGAVLFGNDKTPVGQSFHLLVLCADPDEAAKFREGDATFVLPENTPRSEEIIVIRADDVQREVAAVAP